MPLSDYPQSPVELIKLERQSLTLLAHCKALQELSRGISNDAFVALAKLDGFVKRKSPGPLVEFESYLDILHSKRNLRVFFGAYVATASKTEFENVSYYVSMFDTDESRLLRKFHFDFDAGKSRRPEKKPYYHLQYGGKITPLMKSHGIGADSDTEISSWLEQPRLIFFPMSLIALVAIILKELQPSVAANVFGDAAWLGHLRHSEKAMLKAFHQQCAHVLNGKESLFLEHFYHQG